MAVIGAVMGALSLTAPVDAQQLQALARLDLSRSGVTGRASGDVDIALKLTQAVPYRVVSLTGPPRLVLDFREVRFDGVTAARLLHTELVSGMRVGLFRPGWSRMVLDLVRPMTVFSAGMTTDRNEGDALIEIRLTPLTGSGPTDTLPRATTGPFAPPKAADLPAPRTRPAGERNFVVALDPGHGGIDPGARYSGHSEADLMLTLAREIREKLLKTDRYDVFLTRNEDVFVSLQGRISRARQGGADVMVSLHADALASGTASGTTVYTLSKVASNKAAAYLAASHQRGDLLAGVDLARQDDQIATVLMDMARLETTPRSKSLADDLVVGIGDATGKIRARPRLSAGFSVLKAPDIPSVLVENGFMSNPADLSNLTNPAWRAKIAAGILAALDKWSVDDAAKARLLRR